MVEAMSQTRSRLALTRVVNACVLFEFDNGAVLTDPYFDEHWLMRLREPIGVGAEQLPRLAAIIGGHGVFDHWQPRSLAAYRFKAETPVFVATRSMARKARAAGFPRVAVLEWGETRMLDGGVKLEVAPAQRVTGMKVSSYVLESGDIRVFIGTEARDLEPLRQYRADHAAVDVALLPIDGSRLMGHKLVMEPRDALEGARILGARTLVPIHYALAPKPLLLQTPFSDTDLLRLARDVRDLEVVCLPTGVRWEYAPRRPMRAGTPT
jgi:L-ascorbate metabolism protein UlaG (beta-lactamase superfamily)